MVLPIQNSPKYSFIIATLDDDGELEDCLISLTRLKPGADFEVIIVDQNGDDRLQAVVEQFSVQLQLRHIQVAFKGASRARNVGAELAQGNWLSFPDDDCQLLPNFLLELDRLTSDSYVRVITGKTIDESGQANVLRWSEHETKFSRWTMFKCLTEATLIVEKSVFDAVHGFDERFGPGARFPAAEGIDLMNRLFAQLEMGQAIYSPELRMIHPTKIPPWNSWAVRRFHSYAIGDGALIAKSMQPHILYWGLRTIISAIRHACTLRGWLSLAYVARLWGLMTGFLVFLWLQLGLL